MAASFILFQGRLLGTAHLMTLAPPRPDGGKHIIEARAEGGELVLAVSDEGRGFDPGAARLTGKGGGPIEAQVRPDLSGLEQHERDALRAILERRAGGPAGGTAGA